MTLSESKEFISGLVVLALHLGPVSGRRQALCLLGTLLQELIKLCRKNVYLNPHEPIHKYLHLSQIPHRAERWVWLWVEPATPAVQHMHLVQWSCRARLV